MFPPDTDTPGFENENQFKVFIVCFIGTLFQHAALISSAFGSKRLVSFLAGAKSV